MNPFGKQRDDEVIFICEEEVNPNINDGDLDTLKEFVEEECKTSLLEVEQKGVGVTHSKPIPLI